MWLREVTSERVQSDAAVDRIDGRQGVLHLQADGGALQRPGLAEALRPAVRVDDLHAAVARVHRQRR